MQLTKKTVLLPIRPVWRRLWAKLEMRLAPIDARVSGLDARVGFSDARVGGLDARIDGVEARLGPLMDRLAPLEARIDGMAVQLNPLAERFGRLENAWREHVPSFLNAIATVPAFSHELLAARQLVEALRERVEAMAATAENMAATAENEWSNALIRAGNADASIHALWERLGSIAAAAETERSNTTARSGNTDASIRALWERIEFVRREILFEMSHGAEGRLKGPAGQGRVVGRILDSEKVDAARAAGELRLNLGCGHIALPDYVNVDMRELPGVDVVADVGNGLPFEAGSVDEISSAHLLEHFPQEAIRRRLLPYWRGLLRAGGTFRAVTPDAAAMLAAAGAGEYAFEDFREVVFGSQDYDGDYHFNLFTPDSLRSLLEEAGFVDVDVPAAGRRNGKCFEFEIVARRP